MELIDKDALVAEIDRLENKLYYEPENFKDIGAKMALDSLKSFLDTLEMREVNLEKEINKYISDNFFGSETTGFFTARTNEEPNDKDMALCAKHFFELGLSSQLSWQDVKRLSETGETFMNSEESDNLSEEEYYTEILNKFKAQKG